jgi:hypothetical protein
MTTKSDRNTGFVWNPPGASMAYHTGGMLESDTTMSNIEASVAGLVPPLPAIYKRASDFYTVDPSYDQSHNQQLMDAIAKLDTSLMKTEAVKADSGRTDWTLLPFETLEEVAKVLEFGAKKYSGWNWTTGGGFQWLRVARAALNHIFKWLRGEDNDDESGLSHIAHAMCNLIFLLHYIQNKDKYNKDNRAAR